MMSSVGAATLMTRLPGSRRAIATRLVRCGSGSAALARTLEAAGASIVAGPVELQGARGKGTSVYVRDPEANLLEFIIYEE